MILMSMMKKMLMVVVLVSLVINRGGGKRVAVLVATAAEEVPQQQHHVVGNDQGWAAASDLVAWLSGRVFNVGDSLWFAYSSGEESIVEVGTYEEFLACNVSNPIRMYTSGLDKVSLDSQGTRYFTSSKSESCINGLKLPVTVAQKKENLKKTYADELPADLAAEGPTSPSAAAHFSANVFGLFWGLFVGLAVVFYMGF